MNTEAHSMTGRILRGVVIMFFREGWSKFLGVVGMIILARIFFPSEMGCVLMVDAITEFLSVFGGKSIIVAIVRQPELDEEGLSGAVCFSALTGLVIAAVVFILAAPVAWFFKAPSLTAVLHCVAIGSFLYGLATGPIAILERRLNFFRSTLPQIVGETFYWVTFLVAASSGHGVMSLGWAILASTSVSLVIAWVLARPKIRFTWRAWDGLIKTIRMVAPIELVEYMILNMDSFFIMRFLGPAALGFYGLAYRFSNYFYQEISTALSGVFFPVFRMVKDLGLVKQYFLKMLTFIGIIILPFYLSASLFSREVIALAYGPQWLAAAFPFGLLCVAGIIKGIFIGGMNKDILYARGSLSKVFGLKLTIGCVNACAVIGALSWGINGVALAVTCASLIGAVLTARYVGSVLGLSMAEYAASLKVPFLAAGLMGGSIFFFKMYVSAPPWSWTGLLLGGCVYIGAFYGMGFDLGRHVREGFAAIQEYQRSAKNSRAGL